MSQLLYLPVSLFLCVSAVGLAMCLVLIVLRYIVDRNGF